MSSKSSTSVSCQRLGELTLSPTQVSLKVGLSKPTIWRMRRQGDFPAPMQLSPGRIGWTRGAIDSWLESRSGERRTEGN